MLRTTILIAAGAVALAGQGLAKNYNDAANNFRIATPDDWNAEVSTTSEIIKFRVLSPRVAETRGMCAVVTKVLPEESRAASQADIDADGDKTVDEAFWITGMKKAKNVEDVSVEAHGAKMINGHKAYFVVANLSGTVPGVGPVKAKTQQLLEAIPGQLFIVTCAASDTGYAREEADFVSVLNSFSPIGDAPIAMMPSAGVTSLTMYSEPRFGGVSRVVTQDAANVAVFGWHGTTASMSIAGSGAWEVCDGTSFSGRCETITAAMPTGPNGKGFTIASARHIKPILPPQPGRTNFADVLAQSVESAIAP